MNPFAQSLLTFAVRRGLTILGGSASAISDDDVKKVIGVLFVIGNEAFQFYKAWRAEKSKQDVVRLVNGHPDTVFPE